MNPLLKITIILTWSAAAMSLAYAGGQAPAKKPDDGNVQSAIQFERAKDAADARQARIEEQERGAASVQSDAGVREAIRFERAKDAADARQARIEARQARSESAVGSANRSRREHR